MSFYFSAVPFIIDEDGKIRPEPLPIGAIEDVIGGDSEAPFPDAEDYGTQAKALYEARRRTRGMLLGGIARTAQGVEIHIYKEKKSGNQLIYKEEVHKGCMICPACFSIEPNDGGVFSPGDGTYNFEEGCWLMDRQLRRLVYAWTKVAETVLCKKCGQESNVSAIETGIDEALYSPLRVRHVGLRGSACSKNGG